jgi:hypothetical protein
MATLRLRNSWGCSILWGPELPKKVEPWLALGPLLDIKSRVFAVLHTPNNVLEDKMRMRTRNPMQALARGCATLFLGSAIILFQG